MGQHIVLGPTDIAVIDQDFGAGYQDGYLRFIDHYQDKPLTEAEVYGFLVRNLLDVITTDRYRAGYVVGWCAALHGQGHPGLTVGYYTLNPHSPLSTTPTVEVTTV